MPNMSELVQHHGSIRRYRIELVVEHTDGFQHKIASANIQSRAGLTADDMHREMIKAAANFTMADIATDAREKQARSKR